MTDYVEQLEVNCFFLSAAFDKLNAYGWGKQPCPYVYYEYDCLCDVKPSAVAQDVPLKRH